MRAQGGRKPSSAGHVELEVWVTPQGRGGGRGAALGLETQLRGSVQGHAATVRDPKGVGPRSAVMTGPLSGREHRLDS